MAHPAVAVLESALRARKLDRTLTTTLPSWEWTDPSRLLPTDIPLVDACLRGGLPRGQVSELTGACSAGRMTLLLQLMAAATRRGEIAALVDTLDRLDVASAAAAGVDLDRLLWIRGADSGLGSPGLGLGTQGSGPQNARTQNVSTRNMESWSPSLDVARDALSDSRRADPESRRLRATRFGAQGIPRPVDRALKALNLVLQAGGFGIVAIDLADVPAVTLRQIPFTTWPRVQRVIEGSDTACVLVTPEPLARSAGGLTLSLASQSTWAGVSDRGHVLQGIDLRVRVVSPRKRIDGDVRVRASVP